MMVDEVEVMRNYLKCLKEPTVKAMTVDGEAEEGKSETNAGVTVDMKLKCLDNLDIIVENIDMAINLNNIGGYAVLIDILSSGYVSAFFTYFFVIYFGI